MLDMHERLRCQVDKGSVIRDANDPLSQMQKVAFYQEGTERGYLSIEGDSVTVVEGSSKGKESVLWLLFLKAQLLAETHLRSLRSLNTTRTHVLIARHLHTPTPQFFFLQPQTLILW